MIEIKFTGEDVHAIRHKMSMFLSAEAPQKSAMHSMTENSAVTPEKRKPGRPPKNPQPPAMPEDNGPIAAARPEYKGAAVTSEQLSLPIAPPQVAAREPSLEETKHAVNRVLEAKGIKTAHECIKQFGANKITELAKDKWAALIDHCNQALN